MILLPPDDAHDALDVREFLASPRHAHYFRTDRAVQAKIENRRRILLESGTLPEKTPIVSLATNPSIVELHDGNASCVAWLLAAKERGVAPILRNLRQAFPSLILLRERVHTSGEAWHPFVPIDVACASRLEAVIDREQGTEARKAITREGTVVRFDDREFFSGIDASLPLGEIAAEFEERVDPSR